MHTIQHAVAAVLALDDLRPNTTVNNAMTRLVNSVLDASPSDLSEINAPTRMRVKQVSATAETEMELHWVQKIVSSPHPAEALRLFPYSNNYVDLTRREITLVQDSGKRLTKTSRVLVIGSGPLPLSAIEIHRQSGATVDHVDMSQSAIDLAMQLGAALRIDGMYFCAAGDSVDLRQSYDLILIAALAGNDEIGKQAIIDNVLPSLLPGGRIIVRSATGARTLLYSAIDASKLTGVTLLRQYHPSDHIINSVLVFERSDS